jgi:hypothetical protein
MFQEQVLSNLSFENLWLLLADVAVILGEKSNRKECTRLFWLDVRQQIENEIDRRLQNE